MSKGAAVYYAQPHSEPLEHDIIIKPSRSHVVLIKDALAAYPSNAERWDATQCTQ